METVSLFNGKNAQHNAMGEGQDDLDQSNREEFSETPSIGLWTVSGPTLRGLFSKTISHSNFMIQGAQKHVDVPLVVSPVKRLQETPYIIDQIKDGQLVISFISRIVKRGQVRQNKNQTTRCVVKHV